MKSILLTGATGGLGRQLTYEMTRQGIRPICLVREGSNTAYLDSFELEKRIGDVRRLDQLAAAVEGIDVVIHCVAWVNFRQDKMTQFTGTNVFGALNVYKAATAAGVKRFIQVSSVAAIGAVPRIPENSAHADGLDEAAEFNLGHLQIPYILTKHAAEQELLDLAKPGRPELVMVNPSIMVAPSKTGDDRGKALKQYGRKFMPSVPNKVNLVDIRDVAPAIVAAIDRGRERERYILGGENISARDLLDRISNVLGKSPTKVPVPRWFLDLAAQVSLKVHRFKGNSKLSFYPDLVKFLDYDWIYSSEKAKRELGFRPRPLDETIRDLLTNSFEGTFLKPATIPRESRIK
ncbi:MAG: NAD-dependent epimerase/dehydratase family protein [Candidatus Zixiibacteriota bacterium]